MLNKVFKYIETEELADTLKFSADEEDAGYRFGGKGSTTIGTPDILWENIAFIQDKKIIWTHGEFYCQIQDLSYYLLISDYEEDINAIDEALSYAISEHEKDIQAIDEAVSYAISEHENRLNEQEYTIGFALNDLHNDVTAIDEAVSYAISEHEKDINDIDEAVSYAISDHEDKINALTDDIDYLMDAIENIGGSIDLSSYVTKSELSEQSYLTEIPNTYATYAAITAMGYLTSQDISGLATESYVITKVADLVNAAPETLNTLNELAAALGNDPNFATTTATALGNRVTKDELAGLGYVTQTSLSSNSYAGYSYVYAAYSYIITSITDNELVISTALNNHESRIDSLENANYLTAIPNTYATYAAIESMGYITMQDISAQSYIKEIPSTYATYAAITAMGYLTSQDISGLATESYVTTKVAELVDSAPSTLNTLNELATALGNDPNFATTVSNQIEEKISKTELSNQSYVTSTALSNQSYVTTTVLSNQGYLTTHQNIKTINNNSLIGTGDITIQENVQGNWDEDDSTSNSYILNKPIIGNAKIFYGTCSTAAATVNKEVVCESFTSEDLVKGALIFVTFDTTNSGAVADISLNVNNTGAKHITKLYNTTANPNLTAAGELKANKTYLFGYDGTYWVCLTLDYNSTGTSMSVAEYQAGTGSSARTITPARLKEAISYWMVKNQADWNETDETLPSYILNKPTIPSIAGLATEQYVNTAVAGIVNSAPETLDTLNELATALGNDPNFAATTATALGNRVTKDELAGLGYITYTQLSAQGYLTSVPNTYPTYTAIEAMGYATYSYVQSAYAYILNIINEDELVTSTALNDHNTRISTLENAGYITSFNESDPIFVASAAHDISSSDITAWNNKVSNVQADWNTSSSSDESYIKNKPTIPEAVTESTVSGWGFTKNAGTLTSHAIHKLTATNETATSTSGTITFVESLTGTNTATSGDLTVTATRKSITIPTVNDTTITITKGSYTGTFTTNASIAKTINLPNELPSYSSSDSGKILSVNSSGQLVWITPVSIYTGSGEPVNSMGNDGDIYLQS